MPTLISSLVLQSNWTPSGETTTGVLLFQSLLEENQNDCQFLVRLKFGMNGLQTPIYTESKGIFLEPGSSALLDFRSLVPDTLSFNDPNIRWIIETRLGFNFAPISVKIQEFDSLSFENELTLAALNAKAEKIHTHQITDIQNLNETLIQKLDKPINTPIEGQTIQFIGGLIEWTDLTVFATPVQWQKLTANATLETDKRYFVKGGSEFTLPATVSGSIEVSNQTTSTITIIAAGTARINGIGTDNSTAISLQERVRIKPGKSAKLIADSGNWESQDCDAALILFAFNGVPLSANNQNPRSASGLFQWIGLELGNGVWQNPANTLLLTSITSAMGSGGGTVGQLSNRATGGQIVYTANQVNSYYAWRFQKEFTCTGFWFQTDPRNVGHPRNWQIRVSTVSTLANGADISSWIVAQSWNNQIQITGANAYFYFPIANPIPGNALAFVQSGLNSQSDNGLFIQQFEPFGFYAP